MSLALRLASRWVAGEDIESAISVTKKMNSIRVRTVLNVIGEHYKDKYLVERSVGLYLEIMENMRTADIEASLSVKPSQIGLEIGKGYCLRNFLEIVNRAKELGIFIWMDMESPSHISSSIDIYLDVYEHYKNIGICLQANMERTRADMLRILKAKGKIRLVKGAYNGDFKDWEDVEISFSRLMRLLFAKGNNFAIATHDEFMIEEAKVLQERYSRDFEFQFLRGVKRKFKLRLAKSFQVADYTPFGRDVISYAWRRFKEKKSVFLDIMR